METADMELLGKQLGGVGGAAEPAIDEGKLLENMAGYRDILMEAAQVFLDDMGRMMASLEDATAAGDPRVIESAAHMIKGALLSMAATPASRLAATLEHRGRTGEPPWPEGVRALAEELVRVRAALLEIMSPDRPQPTPVEGQPSWQ